MCGQGRDPPACCYGIKDFSVLNLSPLDCGYIFECRIFITMLHYKNVYFATAVFTIPKMTPELK